MQHYRDIGGDSGIAAYEVGSDSITVEFKHGGIFLYNYASAGSSAIETMKQLAAKGNGLNTYINKYVKNAYASRLG